MRRSRSRGPAAMLAAVALSAAPGADAAGGAPAPAVAGPSNVVVDVVGGTGPMWIRIDAGTSGPHVEGLLTSSWVCIETEDHERMTEVREGRSVQLRSIRIRRGCAEPGRYRFDHASSRAEVGATITTVAETSTYELQSGEWVLVASTRGEEATATIDGVWTASGQPRVEHSIVPPICYSNPPTVCSWWRPRVAVSGASTVVGTVTFDVSETVSLASHHRAWMEWGVWS